MLGLFFKGKFLGAGIGSSSSSTELSNRGKIKMDRHIGGQGKRKKQKQQKYRCFVFVVAFPYFLCPSKCWYLVIYLKQLLVPAINRGLMIEGQEP